MSDSKTYSPTHGGYPGTIEDQQESKPYGPGDVRNIICPRCRGFIPNNQTPGAYPGALSRVDNETEVCSSCGTNEAMFNFLHPGVPLSAVDQPVYSADDGLDD